MSEYQHYEWLAIDRPLTDTQRRAVQSLSSHMDDVTPTHAQVTYSYGDFKHTPIKVLTEYFDAHLYVANWGTTRLAFRLPSAAINADEIEAYIFTDHITFERTGNLYILTLEWDEEGGSDWVEVDGVLAQLAGVRQQIINGDYRALYLAWLAFAKRDDDDEERAEPPVPSGLDSINGALKAFCNLFGISTSLIKAAAKASPQMHQPTAQEWRAAIAKLPRARCDDFLLRLLADAPQLGSALRKELLTSMGQHGDPTQADRRTVSDLRAEAERIKQAELRHEKEAAYKARMVELDKLEQRETLAWHEVGLLLQQKKASAYNDAVQTLIDLRDLAVRRNSLPSYHQQLATLLAPFQRSHALIDRVNRARLYD